MKVGSGMRSSGKNVSFGHFFYVVVRDGSSRFSLAVPMQLRFLCISIRVRSSD